LSSPQPSTVNRKSTCREQGDGAEDGQRFAPTWVSMVSFGQLAAHIMHHVLTGRDTHVNVPLVRRIGDRADHVFLRGQQ
jgi:hypothetical protein